MAVRASTLAAVWFWLAACSSSANGNSNSNGATGGASGSSGGANATSGASSNTGGAYPATGGAVAIGGAIASAGGGNVTGGASASTGGTKAATGGASTGLGGAAAATGGAATAEPNAQDLLNKVAACSATATVAKSGFGLDSGQGNIAMYQCQGAIYWQADMDVDCDGIQTPPCDTDKTGQPQTSIVDAAPSGDVDPTKLPYFVIPLGSPETTWYKSFGIELGQVGAVIYKGSVRYGIFADEAGGAFIGEASYAMCALFLGTPSNGNDPCDPNQGGIDPAEVTYVTFVGATNRASGNDIYAHDTHTAMGVAAAHQWLSH